MKKPIYLILLLGLLSLAGCKTKYISVPEVHQVYVNKHDTLLKTDSIYEKDSIYITTKGDTIIEYRTKYLYRDRWRERIVYKDSLRSDTIRVPYPVVKEVPVWKQVFSKTMLYIIIVLLCVFFIKKWLLARSKC